MIFASAERHERAGIGGLLGGLDVDHGRGLYLSFSISMSQPTKESTHFPQCDRREECAEVVVSWSFKTGCIDHRIYAVDR